MTANTARIGWIVDAQNDFMLPAERGGRLYVHDLFDDGRDPGAQQILPQLVHAVQWMRAHCDVVVYTGDWHAYGDAEIDPEHPDAAKGTYPPHCMGLSDDAEEREGAQIIPEIRPENPVVLARDASANDADSVVGTAIREHRPIFIHKEKFSVFEGNAATDPLLHALRDHFGALDVVMVGVARDVCVKGAIEGFLERGQPVTLVADATWGLGLEPEAESLGRWMNGGAALITTRGLDLRAAPNPADG